MSRMLGDTDIAFKSASRQFWVVDANVSDLLSYFSVCVLFILFSIKFLINVSRTMLSASSFSHRKYLKNLMLNCLHNSGAYNGRS